MKSPFIDRTGVSIIEGVKTFDSFPITPSSAPTTNYQVANKKYVDDNIGGGGISDGDKGDITVSSSGTVWEIDDNVIDTDNFTSSATAPRTRYVPRVTSSNVGSSSPSVFWSIGVSDVDGASTTSSKYVAAFGGTVWQKLKAGYADSAGEIDGVTASIDELNYLDGVTSDIQTQLNNKRTIVRVSSTTSTSTLAVNADNYDRVKVTALAASMTISAPTGTPTDCQQLVYKIKDNGTTRTLTWNDAFVVIGTTLPTATTAGKWHIIGCEYDTTTSKWQVIAVTEEA